jgi:hypothetical protein
MSIIKTTTQHNKFYEIGDPGRNFEGDKQWPEDRKEQRKRFQEMGIGLDPEIYDLKGLEVVWTNSSNPSETEEGVVINSNYSAEFNGWEDSVLVKYPSGKDPVQTATWKLKTKNPEFNIEDRRIQRPADYLKKLAPEWNSSYSISFPTVRICQDLGYGINPNNTKLMSKLIYVNGIRTSQTIEGVYLGKVNKTIGISSPEGIQEIEFVRIIIGFNKIIEVPTFALRLKRGNSN